MEHVDGAHVAHVDGAHVAVCCTYVSTPSRTFLLQDSKNIMHAFLKPFWTPSMRLLAHLLHAFGNSGTLCTHIPSRLSAPASLTPQASPPWPCTHTHIPSRLSAPASSTPQASPPWPCTHTFHQGCLHLLLRLHRHHPPGPVHTFCMPSLQTPPFRPSQTSATLCTIRRQNTEISLDCSHFFTHIFFHNRPLSLPHFAQSANKTLRSLWTAPTSLPISWFIPAPYLCHTLHNLQTKH